MGAKRHQVSSGRRFEVRHMCGGGGSGGRMQEHLQQAWEEQKRVPRLLLGARLRSCFVSASSGPTRDSGVLLVPGYRAPRGLSSRGPGRQRPVLSPGLSALNVISYGNEKIYKRQKKRPERFVSFSKEHSLYMADPGSGPV